MERSIQPFFRSVPGRILLLSVGTFFTGGGAAALVAGLPGIGISAFSALVAVALAIFGFGLAVEDYGEQAVLGLVVLPFGLFAGALAVWLSMAYAPNVGLLLACLGTVAMAVGVVPNRKPAAKPRAEAEPAHAAAR